MTTGVRNAASSRQRHHAYTTILEWTGDLGQGTSAYSAYSRNHSVRAGEKSPLALSSDPLFRGDPDRYSPEELLVASLSSCHMLWFLHLCADAGIIVTGYVDEAHGTMVEEPGGSGQFTEVILRPVVTVAPPTDRARLHALHEEAHRRCFIARSVNFPVRCDPSVVEPEHP